MGPTFKKKNQIFMHKLGVMNLADVWLSQVNQKISNMECFPIVGAVYELCNVVGEGCFFALCQGIRFNTCNGKH